MNVTITGAAGRIGGYVTRALLEAGLNVRATDRRPREDSPVPLEIANLSDSEVCYDLLADADALVHLGNIASAVKIKPQKVICENTAANINVFQAAEDCGVKKILFASSIQAITRKNAVETSGANFLPYLPLDGDVPANPGNAYGLSKQFAEAMLSYFALSKKMECVAIRFPVLVCPEVLRLMATAPKNSAEAFAFLHISDATALILACLHASLPGFRIYFPAATRSGSGAPAAELIREHYANVPLRRPIEQIESLVDISRIQSETGWFPRINDYAARKQSGA